MFTFIQGINEKQGLYRLGFEDVEVSGYKLKLNTYSNFSVPGSMNKDHIKAYHYDQLIDRIVNYLDEHYAEFERLLQRAGDLSKAGYWHP